MAAEDRWFELRAFSYVERPRALQEPTNRRDWTVQRSGRSERRRRRRPLPRLWLLPDRRTREEVGQQCRECCLHGPDRREVSRERDTTLVAANDRRRKQPPGLLRLGVQLRLQQHAFMADADIAADGRKQPAGAFRAHVRFER